MTHSRKSWNLHTTLHSVLLTQSNSIQIHPDARKQALKEGLWPIFSERNRTMSKIKEIQCNLVFTIDGNRPVRSMNSFIETIGLVNWTELILFFCQKVLLHLSKKTLLLSLGVIGLLLSDILSRFQAPGFSVSFFFFQIYMFLYFTSNRRFISYHYLHPKGIFHFLISLFATFDQGIIEIVEDLEERP